MALTIGSGPYSDIMVTKSLDQIDQFLEGKITTLSGDIYQIAAWAVAHFYNQNFPENQGFKTRILDISTKLQQCAYKFPVESLNCIFNMQIDRYAATRLIPAPPPKPRTPDKRCLELERGWFYVVVTDPTAKSLAPVLKATLTKKAAVSKPKAPPPLDDACRQAQKEFLAQFGGQLFDSYLKDMIPLFFAEWLEVIRQPETIKELGQLVAAALYPQQDPVAAVVPEEGEGMLTLQDAIPLQVEMLIKLLQGITSQEKKREDLAGFMVRTVFKRLYPDADDDEKKLAHCLIKLYFPDVALASLQAFQIQMNGMAENDRKLLFSQLATFLTGISVNPGEQMAGFLCSLLQHQFTVPFEAGLKKLMDRLSDPKINAQLIAGIRQPFLKIFFSEPSALSLQTKIIFVKVLQKVSLFLTVLVNTKTHIATEKISPAEKNERVLNGLLQNLCLQAHLQFDNKSSSQELYSSSFALLMDKILWQLLYPPKDNARQPHTPGKKLAVFMARTLGTTGARLLLQPYTLHLLAEHLLKKLPSLENPFDRPPPQQKGSPDKAKEDISDKAFVKDLDTLLANIIDQVLKFNFQESFVDRALGTVLKVGANAVTHFVSLGSKVEKGLNELAQSDATLLPATLLTQLLFQMAPIPEVDKKNPQRAQILQKHFLDTLTVHLPNFNIQAISKVTPAQKEFLKKKMDQQILASTDSLEKVLEPVLPLGTRGKTAELIQRSYALLTADRRNLEILASYILAGLLEGMRSYIPQSVQPKNKLN